MIYGRCPAGLNRLMYTMKSSWNIHMNERWLARWGITLMPPESLPAFQEIVITDKRMGRYMLPGLCFRFRRRIKDGKNKEIA